jgi:peptide/nickel transport system substrate-binding protein
MSLTRREFGLGVLALGGVTLGGGPLVACSPAPTSAAKRPRPVEKRTKRGFVEPPFLAGRVASGALPPIDERLPEQCFVVGAGTLLRATNGSWQDGIYGGSITNSPTSPTGNLNIAAGSTILRSPGQESDVSVPNVVSKFSAAKDLRSFRFTIRRGLRWSDGVKVSTEDVRFLFEDLYQNPQANVALPTDLYTQRNTTLEPAVLTVVDTETFVLTFSRPYGQFVAALNSWVAGINLLFVPAHHLKQFHPKYAEKAALDALLKKNNYKTWPQLMAAKNLSEWSAGEADALGLPVLNAWVLTKVDGQQRVFERNPYFWHVDRSGHQLPYADTVVNNIVVDDDALTTAVMDGQVSVAAGDNVTLNKIPIYKQSERHAGTHVFTTGSFNNPVLLFLNHDYNYDKPHDPWQALVADPQHRFGQAVAAAMDANEINNSVYFGLHGPPMLNSKHHDPDLARRLLDQAGMNRTDSDGFRLAPDGSPFTFAITFPASLAPDFAPVAELLKAQIGAVGLRVAIKGIDGSLFGQKANGNQLMASLHWNDGPAWAAGISNDYMPADKGPWSPATWAYVSSQGKQGRKPPPYLQKFYDLASERTQYVPSSPQGKLAFQRLLDWLTGNYAFIPTTGPKVKPNVVKTSVRNVPKQGAPFELDTVINLEGVWFDE